MRQRILGAVVVSAIAIAAPFVMVEEGNIFRGYADPVGIPTACSGVTGRGIRIGDVFTPAQCDEMNKKALEDAVVIVERKVKVAIDPITFAALISFVYNVGEGNFSRSTLLRKLNAGDIEGACNELPRWIYAKGRKLRGLVMRRERERQLCLDGVKKAQKRFVWRGR